MIDSTDGWKGKSDCACFTLPAKRPRTSEPQNEIMFLSGNRVACGHVGRLVVWKMLEEKACRTDRL